MSNVDTLQKKIRLWPEELSGAPHSSSSEQLLEQYRRLLEEESLTHEAELVERFESLYLPFASWIAGLHTSQPLLIGINGAQGSGKSTISKILNLLLTEGYGKRVITVSIDDFYLRREQRLQLANNKHPLLSTRGVPGTHDIELAHQILSNLKQGVSCDLRVPVFNKAADDRQPQDEWTVIDKPVDIILFEGWCVGSTPQNDEELVESVNQLEEEEDGDGTWRQFVNDHLKHSYRSLFELIDHLVMMRVPSMESVYQWRGLQEKKLIASQANEDKAHTMNEQEVKRFIMHYERITRHNLDELPARADVLLDIDENHQVCNVSYR